MKKLINKPEDVVKEALAGMQAAHSDLLRVDIEQQIIVRYSPNGFPDDTIANGPIIVSTASLQSVCEWFPGLTVDDVRLRFRELGLQGGLDLREVRARTL